jgi:hypothetical protein
MPGLIEYIIRTKKRKRYTASGKGRKTAGINISKSLLLLLTKKFLIDIFLYLEIVFWSREKPGDPAP